MSDAVDAKTIVRLVRYAASHPAVVVEPGEGGVTLSAGKDRPPRHFPHGTLGGYCDCMVWNNVRPYKLGWADAPPGG